MRCSFTLGVDRRIRRREVTAVSLSASHTPGFYQAGDVKVIAAEWAGMSACCTASVRWRRIVYYVHILGS